MDSIAANTFITTQIEMKRLRLHTIDLKGKSKCQKLHIGAGQSKCPNLKVHGEKMQGVTEITYLGDIISNDGKNTKKHQE